MADENDNSLYMAGGAKIFNEMEENTAKQAKVANQQEQIVKENLRDKAQSVSSIKRISSEQGGTSLTTDNVVKLMDTLTETLTSRVGQLTQAAEKQIGPIDEKLKQINDLLSSKGEDDIDKGFELIDKLEKVGVDFNKFGEKTAKEMQKLFTLNANRKANNAEEERIRVEKTQELTQERDILRERGINTYVNEKTLKLEIKSKKEEKIELKRLQEEEKKLRQEEVDLAYDLKQLKKGDTIDKDKQEEILLRQENLSEKNKLLERDKERANLKPKQRVSGMLDQTVGEAFRSIKTFGKEIVQLGGDLFKGLGKLAGVVGKLALGFVKFLLVLTAIILVIGIVGLVIYALYKAIKSVIDFFANIFDSISKIWPFSLLKKDDAKNKEVGDKSKTTVPGEEKPPEKGYIEEGRSVDKVAPGSLQNRSDAMADDDRAKILPINAQSMQEGDTSISNQSYLRSSKSAPVNLNKMSVENQASSEAKSANNTVIAPNVSNSSVNASNTQAMSMEPTNFDRSFINLNSVPI